MTDVPSKLVKVYCGELCRSSDCTAAELNLLHREINGIEPNVTIGYSKFVDDPEHLPPRILDLLQIAAYVFCADRMAYRGDRFSVNNNAWARSFEFHIPVMDIDFWNNQELQNALSEALVFMTGDRKYCFNFTKSELGHLHEPEFKQLSIFNSDSEYEELESADVLLFSGGLDSLAGTVEILNTCPDNKLIVVSHQANTSVIRTQKMIIEHLQHKYQNRLIPYGFLCHNKKTQSKEETQRTRMFLFSCSAFAICSHVKKHSIYVYENGITSINLPIQQDVINARASRTTHPKTLNLMKRFFRFFDSEFNFAVPYYSKTKEDILKVFADFDEKELLASSVSCSATRASGMVNHCGCCSQCIDRRFAVYASGLDDYDANYIDDFIAKIPNDETSQRLWQLLHLASAKKLQSPTELFSNYPDEITNLMEHWHCDNPEDSLAEIFALLSKFSDSTLRAAKAMQLKHDDLRFQVTNDSFLSMLSSREYLKTPTQLRVEEICNALRTSIPQAFNASKPNDENDFNNKVQALLTAAGNRFAREYPTIKFGITSYRADLSDDTLIIESKYLRGYTSQSKATEGIAADITKVPDELPLLFVVYDPERKITNDDEFVSSFELKRQLCFVRIFR